MRSPLVAAAIGLIGVTALAGCGKGASSNALSGLSAQQAVQQASTKFASQSFKFDLDGNLSVDASKLKGDPQSLSQLKALGSGISLSGTGEQESPQRVQLVMSIKPLVDKPVTVVGYDGTAYAALDGTHFADAGSLKSVTGGLGVTPGDISTYLSNLGNVQDKGSESIDGLTAEHYQVALDQSFLSKALGQASQGQSANPFAGIIEQLVQFTGGAIDIWVNQADGSLDRTKVAFTLNFDLDKLSQLFGGLGQGGASSTSSSSAPAGSIGLGLNVDIHPHDYGTPVTITRPTVDPNAPKLPGGLNLFGQGA